MGHLDRAALTRITGEGTVIEPVWSADCRSLAFAWNRTGVANIYTVQLDSGEAPKLLAASRLPQTPGSWSGDGRRLTYIEAKSRTLSEIWLLDRSTGRQGPLLVILSTKAAFLDEQIRSVVSAS